MAAVAATAAFVVVPASSAGATGWSAPHALFPSAMAAYRQSGTMNAGGDVAAVSLSDDHRDVVLYERPAGGRGTTTVVGSATRVDDPQVALSDTGAIAVAWVDTKNGDEAHVAVRPAGSSSFRAPVDAAATRYGDGMNPEDNVRIGIDDAGEVAFAWATGASTLHWGLIGTDGALGTTGTASASSSLSFSVSMNAAGDAVVGWSQTSSNAADDAVRASIRPAGGAFGTPATADSGSAGGDPSTAIDAAGDVAIAYTDWVGGHNGLRVATLPAGGTFGAPVDVSAAGADTENPSVALAGDGTAVVSWSPAYPAFGGRYAARAVTLAGATAGPITTFSASSYGRSQTVLRPDGSGAVLMLATDGLYIAERNSDGTFEPATLITAAAETNGSGGPGAVGAVDAQDGMAVFWPDSASSVSLSYYDLDTPHLSDVAVPAAGTSGTPLAFAATASAPLGWATIDWDFGDGQTAGGARVSHTYAAAGTYTVTATLTDAAGNTDPATATRTVVVAQAPAPPSTGDTGQETRTPAPAPMPSPAPRPATPKPAPHAAAQCKVPSLAGLTTAAAKKKLAAAHCRLGTVTTPKRYKKSKGLVIRAQSRRAGTRTAAGAKVSVTLGVKPKRPASHRRVR
ncbi:PKD domain-containing protein [Conexibacter woesei]|uniref:PKD domain-containing protein n=1 Tax=Conexibacter woesei TaxID=191495 RepID=UPI0004050753|nr:PKD domain-containing protein [Conexibacter woesei]